MALALKEWIDFAQEEVMSYASWLADVCLRPSAIVSTTQAATGGDEAAKDPLRRIVSALLISAFLGGTIGAVIPGRPPLKDRLTTVVVVIIAWLVISVFTHIFTVLLRGKGSLAVTVGVMMQVLAFAYMTSNFLALLFLSAMRALGAKDLSSLGLPGLTSPGGLITVIQLLLLLVLIPRVLSYAHLLKGFGVVVGFIGALLGGFVALALAQTGNC
jgi:hypothetical protein